MRTFNKTPLALGVAAGMAMLVASTGALAISTGTDFNLSVHAKAGGMAGAAYTKPQEISAAIAGNPATLTQFPGVNFNFGAALLMLEDVEYETEIVGFSSNKSTSDADNYILPTLGLGLQVSPNLFLGLGLEVDAGLGADYRDDGINLLPGTGLDTQIGLLVEVISFNANLGAAYKVTEDLSLGATVTIGFGLAQLGTAGDTTGLDGVAGALATAPILGDFGGTTSSVHDIGFAATLGATYQLTDTIMTSATIKSPLEYKFKNIIYQDPVALAGLGVTGDGFQNLDVSQPLEIILGAAYEEGNLLVEADVIWKQWSNADAYEDAFNDQFLIVIGSQYTAGDIQYRLGYSFATDLLKDTPSNTLGNLTGLGSIPLGNVADLDPTLSGLATDVLSIVQLSLLPVIWTHTVTAGGSYNFTDAVSVDAYVAYSFGESDSRDLPTLSAAAGGLNPALSDIDANQDIGAEIMVGAGISIALP